MSISCGLPSYDSRAVTELNDAFLWLIQGKLRGKYRLSLGHYRFANLSLQFVGDKVELSSVRLRTLLPNDHSITCIETSYGHEYSRSC